MDLLGMFFIINNQALRKQKTPLLHGVSLLIGGNAWESNPPLSLIRDIRFEVCGAHQGHIRFQIFGCLQLVNLRFSTIDK